MKTSLLLTALCIHLAEVSGMTEVLTRYQGENATLPCRYEKERFSQKNHYFSWQRKMMMIYSFEDGLPQQYGHQARSAGKVEGGDLSVEIPNVTPLDEGLYTCYIFKKQPERLKIGTCEVRLLVNANFSTPTIVGPNPEQVQPGDLVNLTCHSSGGYPKPTVNWTDGENRPLLGMRQDEFSQYGDLGLWNISSMIQVKVSAKSSFACTVVNTRTNRSITSPAWSGCIKEKSVQQWNIPLYVTLLVLTLAMLVVLGLACQRRTRRAEMTVTVACPEAHQMISTRNERVLPDHSPC